MASEKALDFVLLGPTGYTGKLCAEHIVQHLPTDLRWALAGRSAGKLEAVAKELRALNPDRTQPEILTVQLNERELKPLAEKTRLIINCVGPYHLYSTPVVQACAETGTHYIDVTGETPWIRQLIPKYHETAKSNGAIIIPSLGIESTPPDILTWALVKTIREQLSTGAKEAVSCVHEMKSSGPSGGTLATILTTLETASITDLIKSANPFALAAAEPPKQIPRRSLSELLSGVTSVSDLGTLTTSPSGIADAAVVHRSSTLMREFYGPRFYFRHYVHVRNAFVGVVFHYAFLIGILLLTIPPIRWILNKLIYAPGQGPSKEQCVRDKVEYRGIAIPDADTAKPKRALGRLVYQGDMYTLTGVFLAEAAMVILENEVKIKKVSRGGMVTPASLGQEYVDRLDKVGCHIETRLVDN
ncbi:saccharopine dehydrogenase, putative [Paecilomyces variotii No. 5]|uniref:Saccharopine dehydrogenase, putative n=1 Tax=Byssochlamys spectabilis (strain No. 5 / NBRC 109023) TaxID=1356009 RepID=V5FQB2_BYSSN|nr:saccharopine dehydrogenase, putative [Paecilomyces variotii No. 5]